MADHRAIFEGVISAMNSNDFSLYDRYFTSDLVDEYPQSGELIKGSANARWILENYPGVRELPREIEKNSLLSQQVADQVRVVAPTFSIVRIEGGGDSGTLSVRAIYPDRSVWWIVILYKLRGDQICRSSTFFAPEFEAPAWRAGHVERMPGR